MLHSSNACSDIELIEAILHADIILAADDANLAELNRLCPREHQHKLSLFLENAAVPDPYYGGIEGFEKVLDLIESRAAALVQMWSLALA